MIVTFVVAQGCGETFVTQTMAEYGPALEYECEFAAGPGTRDAANGLSPKFHP